MVLWVGVGFGYAAVAAVFTPLTWPAMLATIPPLAVAGWVALRRPERPGGPRIGLRRILPWLAVLVVGTAWELIALLGSLRDDYPTISSIVSPLAGPHWWFRFVGYLVWFAAGVALVRR